jgi:hypothetical protein
MSFLPLLPSLWAGNIMDMAKKTTVMGSMIKTAEIESAMMLILSRKATEENVSAYDFTCMQFKVASRYNIAQARFDIDVSWGDPHGEYEDRRGWAVAVNDDRMEELGSFAKIMGTYMDQIKIRGELFFFKLHKHFPKKLKHVNTLRDGKVVVEFKNGRTVETHESRLDDAEFLAECVMVHDL